MERAVTEALVQPLRGDVVGVGVGDEPANAVLGGPRDLRALQRAGDSPPAMRACHGRQRVAEDVVGLPLQSGVADHALVVERHQHERRLVDLLCEPLRRDHVAVGARHVGNAGGVQRERLLEPAVFERRDPDAGRRIAGALVAGQVEHEVDLALHLREAAPLRPGELRLAHSGHRVVAAERGHVLERRLEQARSEPAAAVHREDGHRHAPASGNARACGGEAVAPDVPLRAREPVAAAVVPAHEAGAHLVARDRRVGMHVRPDPRVGVEVGIRLRDANHG